eukprot:CAMPEP_0119377662 /NCGR_PEP_ID=MMETSP1334-20130426/46057_1 /TAXON_ID=127549 /ORGANISM="Calcidiscus leptoporus, Strain RCC1130" /LENGTH=67 /DNA_ID=CAMNT_0007396653 /DNA_START=217 /DNA_END=420 /DNA_ORIENTATION=-
MPLLLDLVCRRVRFLRNLIPGHKAADGSSDHEGAGVAACTTTAPRSVDDDDLASHRLCDECGGSALT